MYIARILYPVNVLGPGRRIGIWFNGCNHHCPGCSNPELWDTQERYHVTSQVLFKLLKDICSKHPVDGITLTGGDPFAQPEALQVLLPFLNQISRDILIYTGYEFSQIQQKYPELLSQIGVLIDGKYMEQLNEGLPLRGSSNQNIIALRPELVSKYQKYLKSAGNEIQNFTASDGVISVGIHSPGYERNMDKILKQKGLKQI